MQIVLADDHPILLEGLTAVLQSDPEFRVAARCVNGDEALAAVARHRPDILLLDLRMPEKDGLAVLADLRRRSDPCRVVVLTANLDEAAAFEAIRLGARGILLKEEAANALLHCLREVHAGRRWIGQNPLPASSTPTSGGPSTSLTERELEIVRSIAGGQRNREIAERLGIREGTVKIHLHNVYEKLGISSRVELALLAQGWGLFRESPPET